MVQKIKVKKSFFKFPTLQLIHFFIQKYMVYIVRYYYPLAIQ